MVRGLIRFGGPHVSVSRGRARRAPTLPGERHVMTMKNKVLTAGSLALVLACISTAFTQSAPRTGDANAKAAPEAAPAAPPPPTKVPPVADFRRQFVEVAKTIRPAVVTVTSTSTVEVGGRNSPFEGSPFEFFFRGQRP